MFIEPKQEQLPASITGAKSSVNRERAIKFVNTLLNQRGEWFAFWEADISHLKNPDAARMASLHFVKSKTMREILDIQHLTLEHATRKRNGVLTAYARIK
jgi:hypothetical protein